MTIKEIYQRLKDKFGDSLTVVEDKEGKPVLGDAYVLVKKDKIVEVCQFLRDEPALAFDMPTCVSGLDDGKMMWVVYHLYSTKKNQMLVLKVEAGRENPSALSVSHIWGGANWHERETYDMYGIRFEGHSDLRRILMPESWPGYPLRKDYEYPDEWEGIPLK